MRTCGNIQKVCSSPGKCPRGDVGREVLGGLQQYAVHIGVPLDEARDPTGTQPGHVLPDEHLRVACAPGADADRRDG